jgi:formate hydrogenlyase subunit 3/multisubunit Na+/H+ antiporter MnhD subunit
MLGAAATEGAMQGRDYLLVLAIVLPVAGVLLSVAFGGRHAERIALLLIPVGLIVAIAILADISRSGEALTYVVGGWAPPLGVALRADGISAAMLVTTALVIGAVGLFARADFSTPEDRAEARAPFVFWTLLLAVWAALNAVFLGTDLFNLYVALELLTFGAVPLVCLDGRAETIAAALRYLLFALAGSVLYLLGVALLYGAYGTLDIGLLSARVRPEPATWAAAALMTAGLLAKTALFPLHLWLPPAHAGAPAAASAVLSALVVKGSYFLIVRIWFDAMPGLRGVAATQILGAMGAAAIVFGSVLALRQARLKLLIAYSTVAQIGYLFLIFPLLTGSAAIQPWSGDAWTGGWLQLFSHAFAKAAMFMAAGLIYEALGHDRIADLGGIGRAMPMTMIAFGLAGLSLMGIPPSGGFVAKWLMLSAAAMEGQWWWAVMILLGGLLAGAYVIRVLARAMEDASGDVALPLSVSRSREAVPLALAICALLLGLVPLQPSELLQIGRTDALGGTLP